MKGLSFLRGLSLLLFLNLLIKPAWIFFIDRKVQVVVGHEAYGNYFAFLSLTTVFIFLADAGLSNLLNQRIASNTPIDFSRLLRLKLLLLLIFVAVCLFAAWLAGVVYWQLLVYMVVVQAATSLFVFLRAIVSAHQLFTADAWLSVIDKALMIFLCAGFLYGMFGGFDLVIFLQMQLVATLTAIVIAVFFIVKRKLIVQTQQDNSYTEILKFLLPFAAIIFFMSVHNRADGFLLQRLKSSSEAGIYAAAYRLLDAANVAGYLVASFLLPFLARQKNNQSTWLLVRFTTRNLLFVSLALVAFIFFYTDWVQALLYHTTDAYLSWIIWWVFAVLPAYYLIHVYGTVFTAAAKFQPFIIVMLFAAVLNLLLNAIFIPSYGAAAAAVIAVGSQYLAAFSLILILSYTKKNWQFFLDLAWPACWFVLVLVCCYFFTSMNFSIALVLGLVVSATMVLLVLQMLYFRKNFIAHA